MDYPLPEQRKSCSAEHHAFDEFNSGHLTFYLPVAVNKRQSSQDRRFVSLQTSGKTLELREASLAYWSVLAEGLNGGFYLGLVTFEPSPGEGARQQVGAHT